MTGLSDFALHKKFGGRFCIGRRKSVCVQTGAGCHNAAMFDKRKAPGERGCPGPFQERSGIGWSLITLPINSLRKMNPPQPPTHFADGSKFLATMEHPRKRRIMAQPWGETTDTNVEAGATAGYNWVQFRVEYGKLFLLSGGTMHNAHGD